MTIAVIFDDGTVSMHYAVPSDTGSHYWDGAVREALGIVEVLVSTP